MNEQIKTLQKMIDESNAIVFFGGAGTSTDCGLPDFRGKNGLYSAEVKKKYKRDPEYMLSHRCYVHNPEIFYDYFRENMLFDGATPSVLHYKLAKLEESGKLKAIITQNIDNLHQKAGSKNVIELHGTTSISTCRRCNKEYDIEFIKNTTGIPRCECGGIVKPNVVLYEEQLPNDAMYDAAKAIQNADMIIIAGTSLRVFPAAGLIYEFRGKNMVVINEEKLEAVTFADLMIIDNIKKVFEQLEI